MNETWLKLIPWNGTFEEAIQEAADRKEELDEGEAFLQLTRRFLA